MEQVSYKQVTCDKCETDILVKETDRAPKFYCQACAWDKLGVFPEDLKERV